MFKLTPISRSEVVLRKKYLIILVDEFQDVFWTPAWLIKSPNGFVWRTGNQPTDEVPDTKDVQIFSIERKSMIEMQKYTDKWVK